MRNRILTEKQAAENFINCVPSDYFNIYRECKGEAIYVKKLKRLFAYWDNKKVPTSGKIDFILEPTDLLEKIGWEIGCIGVEVKSSSLINKKPGKAIAQILDYQSRIYSLPNGKAELSMIFLFPYRDTAEFIASIMQQEGLGFVKYEPCYGNFQLLHPNTSHEFIFAYSSNGEVQIRRPRYGKRFGHR
ncbi:MAG: hypothetical protein M1438_00810 [Deltaproteobacteria bacterium]|nr:hypothetical protein [Deltaproteobacteria bacterium]